MSFKAEEERNILQSCCLIRTVFFRLPCGSLQLPQPHRHGRGGSGPHRPCSVTRKAEAECAHQSRGSTGRCEAARMMAMAPVTVSHTVFVPFSQRITRIHPLHSPLLVSVSAVHFFSSQRSLWKKGVRGEGWGRAEQADISHSLFWYLHLTHLDKKVVIPVFQTYVFQRIQK